MTNPAGEEGQSRNPASSENPGDLRRSGAERRRRRIPPLRLLFVGGRRRSVRRREDHGRIILLDRYSPKLFAAIVGILVLSLIDALLTLFLIEHGSSELNPVMDFFLQRGPFIFTVAKYLLTSAAVLLFLAVAHGIPPHWRLSAQHLFSFTLIAFGLVVAWEIVLIYMLRA